MKDDSTKMVTAYRVRTKIFTWMPPNTTITMLDSEENQVVVNMSEWLPISQLKIVPGWFYIYSNNVNLYNFMMEAKIIFRGNDYGNVSAKMNAALKIIGDNPNVKSDEEQDDRNNIEREIEELKEKLNKLSLKDQI